MKKALAVIGAFVTVAGIAAAVAVWLNKLRISLSIESVDDDYDEEKGAEDIGVSIEDEKSDEDKAALDETAEAIEEAIEEMLGDDADEIEVEITTEDQDKE